VCQGALPIVTLVPRYNLVQSSLCAATSVCALCPSLMGNYTEDKRLLPSYAMYSGGNKWKIVSELAVSIFSSQKTVNLSHIQQHNIPKDKRLCHSRRKIKSRKVITSL